MVHHCLTCGVSQTPHVERWQAGLAPPRRPCSNHSLDLSDSPIENAFCRVAPSVLFNFRAIFAAPVFLRASVFSSRTSLAVHDLSLGPAQSVPLPFFPPIAKLTSLQVPLTTKLRRQASVRFSRRSTPHAEYRAVLTLSYSNSVRPLFSRPRKIDRAFTYPARY